MTPALEALPSGVRLETVQARLAALKRIYARPNVSRVVPTCACALHRHEGLRLSGKALDSQTTLEKPSHPQENG